MYRAPCWNRWALPSGITLAAPAFTRSLAAFRSGYMYGRTTKPSFCKDLCRLDRLVIVRKEVFRIAHNSRALQNLRIPALWKVLRYALPPAAFLAPDVFGSSVTPFRDIIQEYLPRPPVICPAQVLSVTICASAFSIRCFDQLQ